MRTFVILFIIFLFSSCAQNSTEKTQAAIDIALSDLSNGRCDSAISVLGDAGYQDEAVYLQVLASAYACKASFNEVDFIANDLATMDTTTANTIFKSLSILSLSPETAADSSDYVSIRTAINYLLQPSLGNPSQVSRMAKFGTRKAGDLGFQALVLNLVNLGKFLNYYGNVSATGVKGGGSSTTNKCFISYSDPRAQALTGVSTGACVSDTDGHPNLDKTTATGKRRMCEGLMLMTNTLDILNNLDVSGSSELSKLSDVATQVNTIKTAAVAAGLGTLINMTSQSVCETYLNTPSQLLDMEYMYALLFETGLQ